jgi:nucleoside-diphosphate-sugar epimerase
MAKLIFGCGYLGGRVARLWQQADRVHVVTRSVARAASWRTSGWQPHVGDVVRPESLTGLPAAEAVLYAVGYDPASGVAPADVYLRGLQHAVAALPRGVPCHFLYVSSTSVYGQQDGGWVDESAATEPITPTGKLLVTAEDWLRRQADEHLRVTILRLAGIYGPGRVPRLAAVRQGQPIATMAEGWLNLIHVDDAARAIVALAARSDLAGTYNVADEEPIRRRDYVELLARLVGVPPPPLVPPDPQAVAGHDAANRRICNHRLRAALGFTFTWPSCRAALPGLVAPEGG